MTQTINIKPSERGTAVVTIAPETEDGTALTVDQLTTPQWQLMRRPEGTVINSRSFALSAITALSWRLTGLDLAMFGGSDSGHRTISVQAFYDSSIGTNNPLNDECSFYIDKLLGQADVTS